MNMKRLFPTLLLTALALAVAPPATAQKKEIIQLQTQVQFLHDQLSRMQQTFDERMGVMKSLIEQSTDNMNRITAAIGNLEKTLQKQNQATSAESEQLSTQVQALHDSLDELKTRVARLTQQLDEMNAARQTMTADAAAAAQAPPADVLYRNALSDYNAGKYDLARQEFGDYLKFYPATELAGNAQFYLGDISYREGNFQQAVQEYDRVLEQYPGGNKAAAAQLKKGFALLELGQREAGVRELNSLLSRFPQSPEATQARDRLNKLSASGKRSGTRRTTPR
jgi:tol-pal system protein YbgF